MVSQAVSLERSGLLVQSEALWNDSEVRMSRATMTTETTESHVLVNVLVVSGSDDALLGVVGAV